ncbi:MAG: hypothetical protein HYU36_16510 [Planctomycetes bacterium]|nr:hypothetical protein [Planctomycetota bacterium]
MRTGQGLEMLVTWGLAEESPELRLRLSPRQETAFDSFRYPPPFVLDSGFLVIPHSHGILFPADDLPLQHLLKGQVLEACASDLSMPWFGLVSMPRGHGVLMILESPEDAGVALDRAVFQEQSYLTAQHHQDSYLSAEDNGARALFDLLYGNPPALT